MKFRDAAGPVNPTATAEPKNGSPAPRQGMSSRLAVGSRDDWQTPEAVLERVRRVGASGEIDSTRAAPGATRPRHGSSSTRRTRNRRTAPAEAA